MASFRLGVAIAGVCISALVLLQLLSIVHSHSHYSLVDADSKFWFGRTREFDHDVFLLGAGKADITGPVVEIDFNGYASLTQLGTGLRQRIYSRAFIVADPNNPGDTIVYLVLDALTGDTSVRDGVLQGLSKLGKEYSRYGEQNIALTGTHSHSGPGAWNNYLLPQIPTRGFDQQSFQALVDGALLSIKRAHESIAPGRLSFGSIHVEDSNINRSPWSYDANPAEERARYPANVDKSMTMLKFDRESDNKTSAVLTFFPVHGTSLYNNNTLVTGDNKGVAAWLFDRSVQNDSRFTDDFVAGFSQSNVGDTTPNVLGAWCEDGSGEKCRYTDSTCGGRAEPCQGRGPYFRENDEGAKSCFEIGRRQYSAAKKLYDQIEADPIPIRENYNVAAFHVFEDAADYTFKSPWNSSMLTTCPPALGFQFAGGTTDGPGAFDFTQNKSGPAEDNPFWYIARGFLHPPTEKQKECQAPKTVLLDVGDIEQPYAWAPEIVDIQVLRVGQLLIIISTSEATTMSGRRWTEAIAEQSKGVLSIKDPLVVLGAPANSYAHYVTTEEEYSRQRYEGASTLYGPNTLAAYINLTQTYLPYLDSKSEVGKLPSLKPGPSPPCNVNNSLSLISGVVYDGTPIGRSFGDVLSSPDDAIHWPGDTVSTTFVGANPRNNLRLESTFAAVERKDPDSGTWREIRTDKDWNLVYRWERKNAILGTSEVTLQWQIEDDYYEAGSPNPLQGGTYRMHYYGDHKDVRGNIHPFEGIGPSFSVATG